MTEIISKLQEDHCHLVKIFDLIERELTAIDQHDEVNFELLSHIIEYIKYYPDVFHHPLEDFVFDYLSRREELRPIVENLQDEHLKLAEMTKGFRDAVTQLGKANEDAVGVVVALGRSYVETQRKHMATEEHTVFPQALVLLSEDEWDQIHEYADMASPLADPVFGSSIRARYQDLRARIGQHT